MQSKSLSIWSEAIEFDEDWVPAGYDVLHGIYGGTVYWEGWVNLGELDD
jgi:hypothetical protein